MANEEWSCAYCGCRNPGWAKRQCRECGISRDLAEFKEELTEQERLALAWATKFEDLNPGIICEIAESMGITRHGVAELLTSIRDKLKGTEKINEIVEFGTLLGLLEEYNFFE